MNKIYFIFSFIVVIFWGCSTSELIKTSVIMFDNVKYTKTVPVNIKIYYSRLEVPGKYFEIGVIKTNVNPELERLQNLAALKGAMAIIREDDNYILIRFFNNKKKVKNVNKKT